MEKLRPLIVILVLLLVFGGGGWYIEAQRARQHSALSGFFESQPTQVSSRIGGRVYRRLVNEGDTVHKGQPLLELDAAPDRDSAAAKLAAAEQAHQQLREVADGPRREDIRKQEAAVAEARANLARLQNGPLPEEIKQARAKVEEAQAQYQKTLNGARPQEIEQARAAERAAWAHLAQVKRGLTPEEKAEAKARLDSAVAQEDLARQDAARMEKLYQEGAISRQQYDQSQTNLREAAAKEQELRKAWQLAEQGSPPEETEQAQQSYQQAKAALDLVLAGSRREDIEAAKAALEQARQALKILLRGSRQEDIRAAQARLEQAQAVLAELHAGNRKEQIAQAKAAAKSADYTAKSAQANLIEHIVRSPRNGIVQSVLVADGDLVTPTTTLVRLDDPTDIWVRVYVPEAKLANVKAGIGARLRVDGIAAPIAAYVESVATSGEFTPANLQTPDERGKQVFAVRLRLKRPDARVKAGMYTTVEQVGDWRP